MDAENRFSPIELPIGLRQQLEAYRGRVRRVKLAEASFAALFGLVASFLAVFLMDRFGDTPGVVRAAVLALGAALLVIGVPSKAYRWVWGTRRLDRTARLLRFNHPYLSDELLGVVQLAEAPDEQRRSPALCLAALRQAEERASGYDFLQAVPAPRHRRWAAIAAVPAVLACLAVVLAPAASVNGVLRWAMPFSATERYTFTQIGETPQTLVVAFAEPFQLEVLLGPDTRWKPSMARAAYDMQKPVASSLSNGVYSFAFPPQRKAGTVTISVGDASRSIRVEPTPRPEIAAITARFTLPPYLQIDDEKTHDVRAGSITLVTGSRVRFEATTTRELASATVNGVNATIDGKSLEVAPFDVVGNATNHEEPGVESNLPARLTLHWFDRVGLAPKTPFVLEIKHVEDEPPTITQTGLGREQVVLDDSVLPFQFAAQDDFGIQAVGIEWKGIADPVRNPNPAAGELLLAAGGPSQAKVALEATFSPKRQGIAPQTLEARLYTIDYLPGRQRVYSPTFVLHVLSPEEHAIWLTRQLAQWLRQAQDVHERELQLHETNKELRSLSPERLDEPANRRRIEAQADAETANARRLSDVTATGDALLEQAARNTQFNVVTLETWAKMLKSLRAIAQNRMPSVADLLKQSATAPPGQPGDKQNARTNSQVGVNRDPRAAPGGQSKSDAPKSKPAPSITDVESSFNETKQAEAKESEQDAKPSSPRLTLPTTDVIGGGLDRKQPATAPKTPAQQKLDEAVAQQDDLLAELAKVAEELKRILDQLEGSTFVKRLKAASRRQIEVANAVNKTLLGGFGRIDLTVEPGDRQIASGLAESEKAHGDNVFIIEQDLEAYANRVQEGKFRLVLGEMRSTQVAVKIREVANLLKENHTGQSIAITEFWADTLDRWAEELVGPGCPAGAT